MTPAADEIIGGRYKLGAIIGAGGWGTVYEATHLDLKRKVAIKILSRELLHRTNAVSRFENEAKLLSQLSHPNIVGVIDFGTIPDGPPYMVLEFVEARSLSQILAQDGSLPYARCVPLFIQIAGALEYAQQKGILHRDIKPSNVLIGKDAEGNEKTWLVDFGLARVIELDSNSRLTQTGEAVGTAFYMSPEQSRGEPVDARSDIYSFGCLMYETLTGTKPFKGDNPVVLMNQHLNARPAEFSSVAAQTKIPRALELVVMMAMEKEPARRFATAQKLQDALEQATSKTSLLQSFVTELRYWLSKTTARQSRYGVLKAFGIAGIVCGFLFLFAFAYHGVTSSSKTVSAVNKLPTTPAQSTRAAGVAGDWISNWGPVHFDCGPIGDANVVSVTGHWIELGHICNIETGTFDSKKRALHFTYVTPYNDQHGEGVFELSPDGQILDGEYIQSSGHGAWTMRRKP